MVFNPCVPPVCRDLAKHDRSFRSWGRGGVAARDFHERLNLGEYEEICRNGDKVFASASGCEHLAETLDRVRVRLGRAGAAYLMHVEFAFSWEGVFIVSRHSASFERGAATETFTWARSRGVLRLRKYEIESASLSN
jgi:hypothetical protein